MPITVASDKITFTDNTSLSSGIIGTEQLAAGAVTTQKIANNAITTNQIGFSGCILQTIQVGTNAFINVGGTLISYDDDRPEKTEGGEVFYGIIQPSSEFNKILIRVNIHGSSSGGYTGLAVFKNDEQFPIAASWEYGSSFTNEMNIEYLDSPNTVLPIYYRVRVGTSAGTFYLNGNNAGSRKYGGTVESVMTLQEIKG